jgi:alkanesulfonate monooxygenase SsuD/methylene tetrahydromethanopterin reductase-like flavin-dependent oxidoreductase (luciferase family)
VGAFEIGVVLPTMQFGPERNTARWRDLSVMALRAETMGFDTLWIADELLWRADEGEPHRGAWDGISMAGATAAVTSRIKVGTAGYTQVDLMPPGTVEAFDAMAPVLERLRAD